MRNFYRQLLAIILSVVMLISVFPASVFAIDYTEEADDYYRVISKKDWELAPGVSESEIVLNNDAGTHRQVAHVVEVDIHNEYTKVIPSYKGMIPTPGNYGVQTMDKQVEFAEANGYGNVVAAMNLSLSWYDSAYYKSHPELVGEPLGYMILDGVQYTNSNGVTSGAQTCVVINFDEKDGIARPADIPKTEIRSTADAITGWEEQVIPANFGFLVKDGVNQYAVDNNPVNGASRSFVGIKADGTFVMVMNDGRQAPFSTGFTNYEMAEFMLSLDCVQAVNGDGGGSSQFLSQRPGEEMEMHCSPSDGGLRDTTHGILVISTAPSTNEFVRAQISTSYEYYTPGSQVKFDAIATNLVGEKIDMPEDITWQLDDASFGTITNDGLFTSNGTVGTVTAQLIYNNKVMGEKEIAIVWPTDFAFKSEAMTVPFGKTVPIEFVATYNGSESYVAIKDGDVDFKLSEATIGTINGFNFTANSDANIEITEATLTATIDSQSDVITITLGKGSEVVFDFENDNAKDGWFIYDYNVNHAGNPNDPWDMRNELIEVVTPETGKVHSGNSALAVTVDYSDAYSNGWLQYRMGYEGEYIEMKNAKKLGFWIWMPEEAYANEWDLHIRCIDANGNSVRLAPVLTDIGYCVEQQDEAGWRYFTADLTAYPIAYFGKYPDASVSTSLSYIQFYNNQGTWKGDDNVVNTQGKFTYFIDDITVEYSDAADDTDAPVFGTPNLVDNNSLLTEINGQTINYNTFGAEVTVSDFVKANATGLNGYSAKAYVDGKEVECAYTNGRISFSNVTINNGLHTVKFEISDNMGNMNSVVREFTAAGSSNAPTVKLVPHDAALTNIKCGSVYYVDLVASSIETTKEITVDLDLVNTFDWEFVDAIAAEGFELSYTVEKYENIATIKITRTGNEELSGEQVVATIPVRVWEPSIDRGNIAGPVLKELWLTINTKKGVLECTDGAVWTFTCDPMKVATEMWMNQWNAPTGFTGVTLHKHTVEAIEDKEATCIEKGYAGRTYCADCASVVDWGTVTPATGHNYAFVDGTLKCACDKLYNGIYEDGKTYIDGLVIADGWVDDTYYYFDGVKLTGPQFIDGAMYTFDENGVYLEKAIFEGFYETRDGKTMYFLNNMYVTGLHFLNNKYYIFDNDGYAWDGVKNICGVNCTFEDGISVSDDKVLLAGICGYGGDDDIVNDSVVYVMLKDGRMIIDGKGATADFYDIGLIPWYDWNIRSKVTSVFVGKEITTIGRRLLLNLDHVTKIEFEKGSKLQTIKDKAMGLMVNLETLVLPEGVKYVYNLGFEDCTKLTSITIPKSVVKFTGNPFEGVENVTIKTVENSYAHKYAVENGIDCIIPLANDVDDNGKVNLNDLVTLAQYMANWDGLSINSLALDMNGDGKIDLADVTCFARRLAGWDI